MRVPAKASRGVVVALALAVAVVALAGQAVALGVTLRSAAHACCHQEQTDRSCLTLCAVSDSHAVLTVAPDPTPPPASEPVLAAGTALARAEAAPAEAAPSPSPPLLYLAHSALLI
ncbi:MAG: hypothetical protein GC160_09980 [Acidobacteria bacterium]|nr:hypothetical protein [Acidobacteriota bacterium]